jgi:hypothetical protein
LNITYSEIDKIVERLRCILWYYLQKNLGKNCIKFQKSLLTNIKQHNL